MNEECCRYAAEYILVVMRKCIVAVAFILFLYIDKKGNPVFGINESGVVTFILTRTNKKYQVVKVSPGGSHLGANWERAGVRGARQMLY